MLQRFGRALGAVLACGSIAGCAALGDAPRPAVSSEACARAAVAAVSRPGSGDKRLHCLGGARIALVCSVAEARLAAFGKEIADVAGAGDADPGDARATLAGIECARESDDVDRHDECCARRGH